MERLRLINESFRDIRPDLKARLQVALEKRDNFIAKAQEYDREVETLQRMIEREEQRFQPPKPPKTSPTEALSEFVFKALRTRPMSKSDLLRAVVNAGYSVDGRSVHATTVNLVRTGKIIELNDGVFKAADSEVH